MRGVCVHAFQIWEVLKCRVSCVFAPLKQAYCVCTRQGRQITGPCSSAVESDLRDSGRIPPGSGDSYRHSGGFSDSFSSHRDLPR
ncbi:hypothetical protein Plhal710r2_c060g0170501 [Plasmopara halstedii]